MQIVPASTGDIAIIQKLAYDIWPHAYGKILSKAQLEYMLTVFYNESILKTLMDEGDQFFIGYEEKIPIGFASYRLSGKSNDVYHLNKIYVQPEMQGKHIGTKLLDHILAEIRAKDAVALQLNVNRQNKAIHFYEKKGFKIIREEDIDIGSGYFMNDYVMELILKGFGLSVMK